MSLELLLEKIQSINGIVEQYNLLKQLKNQSALNLDQNANKMVQKEKFF